MAAQRSPQSPGARTTLFHPVDNAGLEAFRILFGLTMLASVVRFWAKGWIDTLYVMPTYHLPYWGFSWLRPWPGDGMYLHFLAMGLFALGIAVGFRARLCALMFGIAFAYVELLDVAPYLNHYYLVTLLSFLLAFLPVGRAFSLDALRRGAEHTVPAWAPSALRLQIGLVYVFAGLAKLQGDWLFRAEPLTTWLATRTTMPVLGPLFALPYAPQAMSIGGAFYDLTIPFWLLWKPTRPWAFLVLCIFHAATGAMFPIGVFPVLMTLSALVFFPHDWLRRLFNKLPLEWHPFEETEELGTCPPRAAATGPFQGFVASLLRPRRAADPAQSRRPFRSLVRETVGRGGVPTLFLATWFALQLLVPLRAHLYPGNRLWTEQGFRFAWNVMLMEKSGTVEFRIVATDGRQWRENGKEELTALQWKQMSTQPDLILAYAHHLAERYAGQGIDDVAVYADVWVTFNGRARARLIDPTTDLAATPDGFAAKPWILPLPEAPGSSAVVAR